MEEIKRVGRELAYTGTILKVYRDEIALPDGKHVYWDYIHHKGAAAVVAVRPDGKLLMVKQFRNALDRYTLEIPAGARDAADEPTLTCAKRELEEETGYKSDHLELLITLRTTVAFCNELIDVYVARDLVPSHQHLDPDEYLDVEAWDLQALVDKIYRGEIQDAKTVSAILAYKNKFQ